MEKTRSKRQREKKDKSCQLIRIVVRHLPPTMTEKEFLAQVDPLPENDSYYYCPADWSLGQEATCRAYIDISTKDTNDVLQFRDRFDGYVFVDSRGSEYIAIVEYAPFQSLLKNKARGHDNKINTIEQEQHFQEFLQSLEEEREDANRLSDVKIDFSFDLKNDEKVKSTPLLQYLSNKKEKRREEARKRNEEKRKQREEQKQLRLLESTQIKPKEAASNENKKVTNNSKKTSGKEVLATPEITKSSRSTRRSERDQRRREEHEQRKLVREREKKLYEKRPDAEKGKSQANESKQLEKEIVILKKEIVPMTDAQKTADLCAESSIKNTDGNDPSKILHKNSRSTAKSYCNLTPESKEVKTSNRLKSSDDRRIRNKTFLGSTIQSHIPAQSTFTSGLRRKFTKRWQGSRSYS
ncbi:regulator of nonsense transcripts 3B isoform X2 [Drosophila busckii]|uniref:regulator of nonsense transcripts 3B isoform X2 n=1 Tax=Drosophila busckii TaxID=30019 RepID=UPI00083F31BE|nr:regulator of nonsense transcripts 3B isoform X2 [Drosophila busckii]